MCTHQRWITNKYTGSHFLVKCGKCKSCLQEKGNARANRIRNNIDDKHIALFVTLTYDRNSCPYILQKDLVEKKEIVPIYRMVKKRWYTSPDGESRIITKFEREYLSDIYDIDYNFRHMPCSLKHRYGKIGVCYYKDLQDFYKRLRIILQRDYGIKVPFTTFSCSEYGSVTKRPHFHTLIFIPPMYEREFRAAIVKAWPFADSDRTSKYIEIARNAASYVASYVNCGAHLHPLLSSSCPPKHSYSKGFGVADGMFSLDKILSKIDTGDLSYIRYSRDKGDSVIPIPKYVVNRYFPIFKGYSRLAGSALYDCIFSAFNAGHISALDNKELNLHPFLMSDLVHIGYTPSDVHTISVRIKNAYQRFCNLLGRDINYSSLVDYVNYYCRSWTVYKQTILRLFYEDKDTNILYKYDNISLLFLDGDRLHRRGRRTLVYPEDYKNPFIKSYLDGAILILDPNENPVNVNKTKRNNQYYDMLDKEKKVTNLIMSDNGHYV